MDKHNFINVPSDITDFQNADRLIFEKYPEMTTFIRKFIAGEISETLYAEFEFKPEYVLVTKITNSIRSRKMLTIQDNVILTSSN